MARYQVVVGMVVAALTSVCPASSLWADAVDDLLRTYTRVETITDSADST